MRLAIAQINPTVGDLTGNTAKIKQYIRQAAAYKVDILCFPEMCVTGYPPEDLLFKPQFIKDNLSSVDDIVSFSRQFDMLVIVGFVDRRGTDIFNAAAMFYKGDMLAVYHKHILPNYGVFDEKRYFKPGICIPMLNFKGVTLGVNICEDIWEDEGPLKHQIKDGAQLIINISASPYHMGKWRQRKALLARRAEDNHIWVAYNNLVGGQDELVFDGHSMIVSPYGNIAASGAQFEEDLIMYNLTQLTYSCSKAEHVSVKGEITKPKPYIDNKNIADVLPPDAEIYHALMLGLRDYVNKNGFSCVVVGLSGGIDSALTAVIISDALGKQNLKLVFMPTDYSSNESYQDAGELADNLGVHFSVIPIQGIFNQYLELLYDSFA